MKYTKRHFTKTNLKNLPQAPGVYLFFGKEKPLYIGKAVNLKRRVTSYLNLNLDSKTKKMIKETRYFSVINVNSDIESLLLEAKLVKIYKPKYNLALKDDKNPLYIKITKDKYPTVKTARKKDYLEKNILFIGPFPSSGNVRSVLKFVRKIIPYSDHRLGKRGCIYNQIGLCNPCPNIIENIKDKNDKLRLQKKYRNNIRLLKMLFLGKLKIVRKELDKEMKSLSDSQNYEEAKLVLEKIRNLDYITQPINSASDYLKNPNLIEDIRKDEKENLYKLLSDSLSIKKDIKRIECFDVTHISGNFTTSSMVTFINGEPEKKLYRHFRIRQKKRASDTDSLYEVAQRREKYLKTWGKPDLVIVDGGKGQLSVFEKVFKKHSIPVIGIAKPRESIITPIYKDNKLSFKQLKIQRCHALFLLQRLRNESHRFARRYHHKLVSKDLFKTQARVNY